jgi:hypothetical protein
MALTFSLLLISRIAIFALSVPAGYVCEGKIPNSERIKLITRNGIILSWGCDPPDDPHALAAMGLVGAAVPGVTYKLPRAEVAHKLLAGES